ncbi:MAG TPA: hypothetical protein VMO47_15715, partial [Rhodothermales bacterium]|nr:hypothetical protein [Rhodothermales bacterium]
DKGTSRGWAGGNKALRPQVKMALANAYPDEHDPNRGINYLDIHDNWALADRFATIDWDGRHGVDAGPYRIAATLLFTSLGPIVMHGGTEMMRSKGAAPLVELTKRHSMGTINIHGKRDTYNLRVPNHFVWENLGRNASNGDRWLDYDSMVAYWRGLIRFRLSEAGKPFRVGIAQPRGYYRWIEPEDKGLLGYVVNDSILILINTTGDRHVFKKVKLAGGNWRLIGNGFEVDHENGVSGEQERLKPGVHDLAVPAESALIWVRD